MAARFGLAGAGALERAFTAPPGDGTTVVFPLAALGRYLRVTRHDNSREPA